jgi:hypothetical protein
VERERAAFTPVIARLDRATQYSGLPEIRTDGGDYWFPAFAGMTNLCAATTRVKPGDDGAALYVSTWNPPNVDFPTSES